MILSTDIRGLIVPTLTPFTAGDGLLDEAALVAHMGWLIERGVHGLMPCGTTGEGPLLTVAERQRIAEIVVEQAAGRVPVLVHVGTASTRETIELAQHAQRSHADAVSVVTPYYFRLSDAALVEHFCAVADAVPDMPVFLYNIPQCTGNPLSAGAAATIAARCPNVIGIKDSSGNLDTLAGFVGIRAHDWTVLCGGDGIILRALNMGASGAVSGNGNVVPEVIAGLFEAYWSGDAAVAQAQQGRLDQARQALGDGGDLSLFKRALELRGLRGGAVRPPLLETTSERVTHAREMLADLQIA
jgi:4-hydroxy-tetrahydrodipicolinate synthase